MMVLFIIFCIHHKLESRQYNVDYLMDLIEAGDEEGIKQFFAQPKYVTKIKHIVEFTEVFREKLEERFGYKPSYREAYDGFKANLSNMGFPKEQKKQILSIFKEIIKNSEKAERKGLNIEDITMDFKGSKDSDFDMPDQLVIAYSEGLGGCLMCIIPGMVTQGIGAGMIVDAARRACDYLDSRKVQNEPYSGHSANRDIDDSDRGRDRDSWDKEY